jgi:uncharacterized lipoprotein YajG
MFKIVAVAVVLTALAGCGTTNVNLKYSPSTPFMKVPPTATPVNVGSFLDQRGEPPTWLGAIRGGFGNPLKVLESDRPVAELVKDAFTEGLRARGVPTDADAPYQVTGVIRKLDCSQYVRREAHIQIELTVVEKSTQQRFTRLYKSDNVDGSLISLSTGVFASVDDLRAVLEKTLRDVVDQALEDSELRTALRL